MLTPKAPKSLRIMLLGLALVAAPLCASASPSASTASSAAPLAEGVALPTGKAITPTAEPRAWLEDLNPHLPGAPDVRADQAVSALRSPDGSRLAVLTSGFNIFYDRSGQTSPKLKNEYLLVYDIRQGRPKLLQVLPIPNSFQGLAWSVTSDRLYAAGGTEDAVYVFARRGVRLVEAGKIALGHAHGIGVHNSPPAAAGLAISPDGRRLLVANLQNDSVSLIDLSTRRILDELDLRPGKVDPRQRGRAGGTYPRAVVWASSSQAYVVTERDRELIGLSLTRGHFTVTQRHDLGGAPVALAANTRGTRVYVTLDTTNQVKVFDTIHKRIIETVDVAAPPKIFANKEKLNGANTNALALLPGGHTLLAVNGGENALAVVHLGTKAADVGGGARKPRSEAEGSERDNDRELDDRSGVVGMVPTGWYPTSVTTSSDGAYWYVVNAKSPTGTSASWCDVREHTLSAACVVDPESMRAGLAQMQKSNADIHQLEKAGLLTMPAPAAAELARLTLQVAHNNHFDRPQVTAEDEALFAALRTRIKHVIYIIKENRSYDQVLGDLGVGNGEPGLTLFPEKISPNHHALARNFVTLDNFFVTGEVSWTGWDFSTSAQTVDFRERQEPSAMRGALQGDNATNRGVNVSLPTSEMRHADYSPTPDEPDLLAGARNVYAPDAPGGLVGQGYIWDAALRAGKTIRNYGFHGDQRLVWTALKPGGLPSRHPFEARTQTFHPANAALAPFSDLYFTDTAFAYPDFWREQEWKREFDAYSASGQLPSLMLVALSNDHFGQFDAAIDGVNTPDTQMADNDYALGHIVEAVAHSPFAKDTLVISIEDDSCDGPDHVDAHRSIALIAGPYVKQRVVISRRYTTISVVKTIEMLLGIGPLGLNDAFTRPMSEIFDLDQESWTFDARAPDVLRTTTLPLPPAEPPASAAVPRHDAAYWAKAMANQDFRGLDRIDPDSFNRALWRGLKAGARYPMELMRSRRN